MSHHFSSDDFFRDPLSPRPFTDQPIVLRQALAAPALDGVIGWVEVILYANGNVCFRGRVQKLEIPFSEFAVQATVSTNHYSFTLEYRRRHDLSTKPQAVPQAIAWNRVRRYPLVAHHFAALAAACQLNVQRSWRIG